jgi:hypothetical protein
VNGKDFIAQALNNTYWLKEKIGNTMNAQVWISPVLVFTNAFVERTVPIKGVTIINKKFLLNILQRSNAKGRNSALWENREKILETLCG